MTISAVSDFADAYPGTGWFPGSLTGRNIGSFNPEHYGFTGLQYPVDDWNLRANLMNTYFEMASGLTLSKAKDTRDQTPLYPLQVNLWDFVCQLHAYMSTGIEDDADPTVTFKGNSAWERSRAEKYNEWFARALNYSGLDWYSIFYGMNVYGAHAIMLRYDKANEYTPVFFEPIPASSFYPVLDSAGRVIAFFIVKQITHAEAKFRYGVTVEDATQPLYIEYWDPTRFSVQINRMPAYFPDKVTEIKGVNSFGFAPAVYIPHVRKRSLYGDSQLWGIGELVKEFNSRLADVSDTVEQEAHTGYWGYNLTKAKTRNIGGHSIIDAGESYDSRVIPGLNPMNAARSNSNGLAFLQFLWQLCLNLSDTPEIATGADEGSQRSGATLRARFWMLESHAHVERNNATAQVIRLAHMTIAVLGRLGYPSIPQGGESLAVNVSWQQMLPQDRSELIDEVVRLKQEELASTYTIIKKLGDVEDVEQEISRIDEDTAKDLKFQMALKVATAKASAQNRSPAKQSNGG